MLSLLQSPLGFASMPGHPGHPEDNPCDGAKATSALNGVVGDIAGNQAAGKVLNLPCFEDATDVTKPNAAGLPQAGADVTPGVTGLINSTGMPAIQIDLKDTNRQFPL